MGSVMPNSFITTANQYLVGASSTSPASLWESFVAFLRSSDDAALNLSPTISISSQDYLTLVCKDPAKLGSLFTHLSEDITNSNLLWPDGITPDSVPALFQSLAANIIANNEELTSVSSSDLLALLSQAITDSVSAGSITLQAGQFLQSAFLGSLAQMLSTMNVRYQTIYMSFLDKEVTDIRQSEAANALSPKEITGRHTIYTIFDILLTLLKDATGVQVGMAKAIQILAGRQQEYAELARKAVFYVGSGTITKAMWDQNWCGINDPVSTMDREYTRTTPSIDPTQYALGYGNVMLSDVYTYLYAKVADLTPDLLSPSPSDPVSNNTQTFSLFSAVYTDADGKKRRNQCDIDLRKLVDPSGNIIYRATVTFKNGRVNDSGTITTVDYTTSSTSQTAVGQKSEEAVATALNTAFQTIYSQAKANHYVEISSSDLTAKEQTQDATVQEGLIGRRDLKISWFGGVLTGSLTDFTSDKATAGIVTPEMQTQASKNRLMGSYIDSINSQIDLLKDKSDQMKQVQDSASTARQQALNLIQSTLRQLQDLLSSTFR